MPRVRYFTLVDDRLERVAQQRVFDAWSGRKPWDDTHGNHEDRLVEAVFDDADRLVRVDFIRIAVRDSWITSDARHRAACAKSGWRGQPGGRLSPGRLAADHLAANGCGLGLDHHGRAVRRRWLVGMSEQLGLPVRHLLRQYASTLNNLWNRFRGSGGGGH